jgi:hypothetical protein
MAMATGDMGDEEAEADAGLLPQPSGCRISSSVV